MKYTTNRRANTKTIANLKNNEGLTFRYGKVVEYKTGWQVAFAGVEVKTALHPNGKGFSKGGICRKFNG